LCLDDECNISGQALEIGKGRIIRRPGGLSVNGEANIRGKLRQNRVAILSIGTRLHDSLIAAADIEKAHPSVGVTVADARFMKPLDEVLIRDLVDDNSILITIEEGSIGGFGDHVLHFLARNGLLDDGNLKFRPMVLPDELFEAATQQEQYDMAKLNHPHITELVDGLLKKNMKVPMLEEQIAEQSS